MGVFKHLKTHYVMALPQTLWGLRMSLLLKPHDLPLPHPPCLLVSSTPECLLTHRWSGLLPTSQPVPCRSLFLELSDSRSLLAGLFLCYRSYIVCHLLKEVLCAVSLQSVLVLYVLKSLYYVTESCVITYSPDSGLSLPWV